MPQAVYRADYAPPSHRIDQAELLVAIFDDFTEVTSSLFLQAQTAATELFLHGEDLELLSVLLDGVELPPGRYRREAGGLRLHALPAQCRLQTRVRIAPHLNTQLSGLYRSGGTWCTQCEAEGFRRITFFLDRPDVLCRFRTVIEADAAICPVLLGNGNRLDQQALPGGRHRVSWDDPIPKPCYLFALVAGDLHCHRGSFTTAEGRAVDLDIWVEHRNSDRCAHALASLQVSMRWDEERYSRLYDLDIYMIVAVDDFNMGAMENKGLNIFNSKFVLARPDTATDADYEHIEAVIAHEYFHNWTGNRVTCRDWFQLTLKEGLTVFRDQQFTAERTSAAVKRIDDVQLLRLTQFPEDAGPMRHPIRPESYIAMDNFYTTTVYNKGAEVIRMYHTLLGAVGFRRGMDLYFERHDGQAVTCDDFRSAMQDSGEVDLNQFERWYDQAGTPVLQIESQYDAEAQRLQLHIKQQLPPQESQRPAQPYVLPLRLGLIGPNGADLLCRIGEQRESEHLVVLRQAEEAIIIEEVEATPVLSLLRDFSAPVIIEFSETPAQLVFRMAHDSDPFNRWDAGQRYAMQILEALYRQAQAGEELRLADDFLDALRAVLNDARLDGSLRAQALGLPPERLFLQRLENFDPALMQQVRSFADAEIGRRLGEDLHRVIGELRLGAYRYRQVDVHARRLRHRCFFYLAATGEADELSAIEELYLGADNMTERDAALNILARHQSPQRDRVLAHFYASWHDDPLVLDKWFSAQAAAPAADAWQRVQALRQHQAFSLANPNRTRALLAGFAAANPVFHLAPDGGGYRLLGADVRRLAGSNPQLAARLCTLFNQWRRYAEPYREGMREELEAIGGHAGISDDVAEIVSRALAGKGA